MDIRRARVWLNAIAHYSVDGQPRGALADLVYEMDPELWTVALSAGTVVVDLSPDDDQARDEAMARMVDAWSAPSRSVRSR